MRRISTGVVLILVCVLLASTAVDAKRDKKNSGKPADLVLGKSPPPITKAQRDLVDVDFVPGAPGVILLEAMQLEWYKMEFVRSTYIYRAKVLTEDGIDLFGNYDFFLSTNERVQEIEARTVLPDGTEIDASENVLHELAGSGVEVVRVAFPQIQVGSIIELFIRFNGDGFTVPPWVVQHSAPVLESRLILVPPEGLRYATVPIGLPMEQNRATPVRSAKSVAYVWRFTDIEPLVNEPFRPPVSDISKKLIVVLAAYDTPNAYISLAENWIELNKWWLGFWKEWLNKDEAAAKKLARQIVSPEMSDLQKAEVIRQTLLDRIEVSWSHRLASRSSADAVLANGSGNSADLAATTVVMLRAVGVDAYLAPTRKRSDGSLPFEFPVPSLLNDMLVCIRTGGQEVFYSPAVSTPVGEMNYEYVGILALPLDGKADKPSVVPDFTSDQNRLTREVTAQLDASGGLQARSRHVYRGIAATSMRGLLDGLDEAGRVEKMQARIERWIGGAEVTEVSILESDDASELAIQCDWTVSGYATLAGKRMIVNPQLLARTRAEDWAGDTRVLPIHLGRAYETFDTVNLRLPEGVTEVTLPDGINFNVKGVGVFQLHYNNFGDSVMIERHMQLDRFSFPQNAYPVLRQWFSRIAESDNSPLVLTLQ